MDLCVLDLMKIFKVACLKISCIKLIMIYAGITISTITQLIEIIFYLSLRASVKAPGLKRP